MEEILLPSTVEFSEGDSPNLGKVLVMPCHQGYGTTLGNALRRVLLSSLPGAAVESVRIAGVQHEFSTIEGVHEDVVEIILNLKQIAVKSFTEEQVTLSLKKKGKGEVKVADFGKNSDVEIINTDLKLLTITDANTEIEMDIIIGNGRGYVPVEEKDSKGLDLGTILIDSLYTPIRDVGYNVELTRVGDITDYEKLTLNIETNGAIAPKEAVQQATKILMDHFALVLEAADSGKIEEEVVEVEEEVKHKKRGRKKKTEEAEVETTKESKEK